MVLSMRSTVGGANPPFWLDFNATTATFTASRVTSSGIAFDECAGNEEAALSESFVYCGTFSVFLTGVDPVGTGVSTVVEFQVSQAPPTVINPIGDVLIPTNRAWMVDVEELFQSNTAGASIIFNIETEYEHTGRRVEGLPTFLSLRTPLSSRRIQGTPVYADIGAYVITITAVESAYGWQTPYTFRVTVRDDCFDGYRHFRVVSRDSPGALSTCVFSSSQSPSTAALSFLQVYSAGASLPFNLANPSVSSVAGYAAGNGVTCIRPVRLHLATACPDITDLTVLGSPNPNRTASGPWTPLLALASNTPIDFSQEFAPIPPVPLSPVAYCGPGEVSNVRMRRPADSLGAVG
jgi:hypothetical protein